MPAARGLRATGPRALGPGAVVRLDGIADEAGYRWATTGVAVSGLSRSDSRTWESRRRFFEKVGIAYGDRTRASLAQHLLSCSQTAEKEVLHMARVGTTGSVGEVRDSVKRIRGEGERFLGRLRRETQTFARKTRVEVTSDVRKIRDELKARGDQTVRDLETRGRRMVETFEKQVGRLTDAAARQLGLANREDLPRLTKRVYELERRVEQLELELRESREPEPSLRVKQLISGLRNRRASPSRVPEGGAGPRPSIRTARLAGSLLSDASQKGGEAHVIEPAAEVAESDGDVIVKMQVPGVEKDQLQLTVSDDRLTVRGELRKESEEKRKNYYRQEIRYGAFQRSVPLPVEVDAAKASAQMKNGMLTVTLPKSKHPKAQEIKVAVG